MHTNRFFRQPFSPGVSFRSTEPIKRLCILSCSAPGLITPPV
ncbi:hypothetical protein A676_04011 [Salmonella enterica subsp. enterica serovar Enteritidis str. 2010K-0262]|uniref:Uncharacterized protein n=1 Tax=Salmonella enteritidis (strain 2009K0958) TaxID=1192586 RepID=A0A656IDB8_SALE2|nr:hypothetical protein A673_05062 [Salmonella enterica subsp. enterica serovar Enteritidis str. 2009K0958]EPI79999.1 hypothetical protein A675_04240 [Salmonella enterica subsp. enterica serovar Enteritidis str. 2009K1726]EPI80134.1 hypothetical protein A676_04011 [Salmonella enterica subsp. enterica serovar Enteritidis str. 2010K-0262]EPI94771.1 hypothetical protein A677_04719 [Salmonella enterica subsp. enterica serovar Enteritidis str. 2010K-0267]EPI95725.1 hypothetical protein A679_04238 [S